MPSYIAAHDVPSYDDFIFQLVKQFEGWVPTMYFYEGDVPTIGYGIALVVKDKNGSLFARSLDQINKWFADVHTFSNADFAALQNIASAYNTDGYAKSYAVYSAWAPSSSLVLTEPQGKTVLQNAVKDIAERAIPADIRDALVGSRELAALSDLAYNGEGLIGSQLVNAIRTADRAEAWYQIRYGSNKIRNKGLGKRRYLESHIFGLYSQDDLSAPPTLTTTEAMLVFRMFTKHEKAITDYDANANMGAGFGLAQDLLNIIGAGAGVPLGTVQDRRSSMAAAFNSIYQWYSPIRAGLNADLALAGLDAKFSANSLRNIFVALNDYAGSEQGAHNVNRESLPTTILWSDPSDGTPVGPSNRTDDLILGSIDNDLGTFTNASDVLRGGDGSDIIIDDGGADNLFGGDGDDLIKAGAGDDILSGDVSELSPTGGRDALFGDNGNDIIFAGGGDDLAEGGAGEDTIFGGEGKDYILGGADNDYIDAGKGDDTIFGETGVDTILGNEGADYISGWEGGDTLYGGAGNDTLYGGEGNDILYGYDAKGDEDDDSRDELSGDSGDDRMFVGNQDVILNPDKGDRIIFDGFTLKGGTKAQGQEYWTGDNGELYYTSGSTLFVRLEAPAGAGQTETLTIKNWSEGKAGISLKDDDDGNNPIDNGQGTGDETKDTDQDTDNNQHLAVDPLVLDLDGDGIELTDRAATRIWFDMDNDGFAERTGWVAKDDGILAYDRNGDGKITNISELFGENSSAGAFVALASFDSNSDGVVDASDKQFGDIRVWQDVNQNGVTDAGELKSLSALAITKISLANTTTSTTLAGNQVVATGSYTKSSGATAATADVLFSVDQVDSVFQRPYVADPATLTLPTLRGYGDLADLRVAMSIDSMLKDMVTTLAATPLSAGTFDSQFEQVLLRWADVQDVDPASRGGHIDARHLEFIEHYLGRPFVHQGVGPNPNANAAHAMENVYDKLVYELKVRFLVQGQVAALLPGIRFDFRLDTFQGSVDTLLNAARAGAPAASDQVGLTNYWTAVVQVLQLLKNYITVPGDYDMRISAAVAATGLSTPLYNLTIQLGSTITGTAGADTLTGTSGGDVFDAGAGNDVIDAGTDIILFGHGYGQDLVRTANAAIVLFNADVVPGDLEFYRLGATQRDLVIALKGSNDRLTIANYFNGPGRLSEIRFTDGTLVTYDQVTAATTPSTAGNDTILGDDIDTTLTGGAGDDVIYGYWGNDTLSGGTGNDTLYGGNGNDTYVFNLGDGQDVVWDRVESQPGQDGSVDPNIGSAGTDTIRFGPGILPGDLNLRADATGNALGYDLLISIGASDTLRLKHYFSGPNFMSDIRWYKIERFVFDDGTVWESADILALLNENGKGYADDNDNNLIGDDGDNTYNGLGGNDTLTGGKGNDTLTGTYGDDLYIFNLGDGQDEIWETNYSTPGGGNDTLQFGAGIAPEDIDVIQGYNDSLILKIRGTNDQVMIAWEMATNANGFKLENVAFADGTVWSYDDLYARSLQFTDGPDIINGDQRNDIFDGLGGDDGLDGGDGDDTYRFGKGGGHDSVQDTSGSNTLEFASGIATSDILIVPAAPGYTGLTLGVAGLQDTVREVHYYQGGNADLQQVKFQDGTVWTVADIVNKFITGTSAGESINGTTGLDVIDGGGGTDTLTGKAGNDTYIIDSTTDKVVENANEGIDTVASSVSYSLAANVENLMLIGDGSTALTATGNTLDNTLLGDGYGNTLIGGDGNDWLDNQGAGASLAGGKGNDTYVIYGSETFTEAASEGTDTVRTQLDNYTLAANLENLVLLDLGPNVIVTKGSGNTLANTITGNRFDNIIDGGTGTDTLIGGAGNDTYVVDATGDVVTENIGGGTDLVQSSATTYTLGANVENLTLTGSSAINGTGNTLDNVLTGNTGLNTLTGLAGNDTYIVQNTMDVVVEAASAGTDTVQSSATYVLGANVENLTLLDSGGAINGTGNTLDNVLTGNSALNTLTGLAGNDTYIVQNTTDVVVEAASAGTDTVQSSVTYTLSTNVENLVLTGTGAINGTGNTLDNVLTGNSELNTLAGLAGNDTYIVQNTTDVVVEAASAGTDTVQSSVTYTLAANVENLTLTGLDDINATGNTLANTLTGNSGDNILDGGAGADSLAGGVGDDTYVVDAIGDLVTEAAGAGTDAVKSTVTYTLGANVENLTLLDSGGAINGTGNTLDNVLIGNSGLNTLTGLAGNDIYIVQNTTDVVVEAASAGTDTVQSSATYSLSANVENLTLTGSAAINGTGNTLANNLAGNSGDNVLDGGTGVDTLVGGIGNDTYVIDSVSDVVTENASEGTDTVQSSVTGYALAANVENLTLLGTVVAGAGNSLDNVLIGNSAANTLTGGAGNDTLDGGTGTDSLAGGVGDDTYVINVAADIVTEALNEGIDTVKSGATYTLGSNVENLTLTGSAAINGTGNTLDNVLTGNNGLNTLTGLAGNDTYVIDSASDIVVELAGGGTDTVLSADNYTLGNDVENLTLTGSAAVNGTGNTLANVILGNSGINTLTGGDGNDVYGVDNATDSVVEQLNQGNDLVQASVTWSLGANLENLTLVGTAAINGTGNTLNNVLTGNGEANTLDGGTGNDAMIGGGGNDVYVVDSIGDSALEFAGQGVDLVNSAVTFTLSAHIENLTLTGSSAINGVGNSLDNVLTGNTGTNRLIGGLGNDTYVIDSASDVVVEYAGEGVDTVRSAANYTLGTTLENLTLTGTAVTGAGNGFDNVMVGNSANNTLTGGAGNDTIDGGAGTDSLGGGTGDDTYYVDATADIVSEAASEGKDTVYSTATFTLGANVENLTLTGSAVTGAGNTLDNVITGNAGANTLTGLAGNDTLDGGGGIDSLAGGVGNDLYIVDAAGDIVNELAAEGTDTVKSSVTHTLAANVENLVLTGTAAIDGQGNTLDNVLTGNAVANTLTGDKGNDTIDGLGGNDWMVGGAGNDSYVVDSSGDVIVENASEGTDSVTANVSYSLGNNVENLTLIGLNPLNGTGNSLINTITGNGAANTLDGGAGADILIGGDGNDVYLVDNTGDAITEAAGAGVDSVTSTATYSLGANVENLTLTGSTAINGTGNSLDNTIIGNSRANTLDGGGGNDYLDGGSANDTLIGGAGDDTFIVYGTSNVVTEAAGAGEDTVRTTVTYSLGANLENLTLTGTSAVNGTGNTLNNTITGNDANNTLTGGNGNDILSGGGGADTLDGGIGDDYLYGGFGNDKMTGGAGNDSYGFDDAGDTIFENANEGTDTVTATVSYSLAASLENLNLYGGTNGYGNDLDNQIYCAPGLTVAGGLGNDTYTISNAATTLVENASQGIDTVKSWSSYSLVANIENLILLGQPGFNYNTTGTGNTLANTITGNTYDNILDGGTGADSLIGGAGNDTYVVDDIGDTMTEVLNEGIDTVQAGITYTLAANVENLTLTGLNAINGTGNTLDNVLTGNSALNTLTGLAGNDTYIVQNTTAVVVEAASAGTDTVQSTTTYTLGANVENLILLDSGGAINGAGNTLDNVLTGNSALNTLTGLAGNDTYIVQNTTDVVVEAASAGTDTVQSSVTYTLSANVENLVLTGIGAINGTGNALANSLTGTAGDNVLDGGGGTDTLVGGIGNDIYVVDSTADVVTENASEGTDTVQSNVTGYTLATNLENLTLLGTAVAGAGNSLDNVLTGNSAANTLIGGAGNDTLDGGTGTDSLAGGVGDDTYIVDVTADIASEGVGEGIDTVKSGATYTLGVNIENLTLTGLGAINGTGNTLDNVLTGNSGLNTLTGLAGNDTYVIDSASDVVVEAAGGGTDTVRSSATYTLGNEVENLTLTGSAAINGTGNTLANVLLGNSGINTLSGGTGNDVINGGTGNDILIGGDGADTYIFTLGGEQDTIQNADTDGGLDKLGFGAGIGYDQLWFTQAGNDLTVSLIGSADQVTIQGWYTAAANRVDRIEVSDGRFMTSNDVDGLRIAMAGFGAPPIGQTTLDPVRAQGLAPVLAASWHPA